MNKISFHTSAFIKTLVFFLILTILWTFVCRAMTDPGPALVFLTGLGFLVLFPVSIYVGMGRQQLKALVTTLVATIFVFVVGSFMIFPLVTLISNATTLYALVNACFVAITMTLVFDKCYGVKYRYLTMVLVFVALLLAYYLLNHYKDASDTLFNMHPRLIMFNIFQGLLLVPLSLGIATGSAEQAR